MSQIRNRSFGVSQPTIDELPNGINVIELVITYYYVENCKHEAHWVYNNK